MRSLIIDNILERERNNKKLKEKTHQESMNIKACEKTS